MEGGDGGERDQGKGRLTRGRDWKREGETGKYSDRGQTVQRE